MSTTAAASALQQYNIKYKEWMEQLRGIRIYAVKLQELAPLQLTEPGCQDLANEYTANYGLRDLKIDKLIGTFANLIPTLSLPEQRAPLETRLKNLQELKNEVTGIMLEAMRLLDGVAKARCVRAGMWGYLASYLPGGDAYPDAAAFLTKYAPR